MGIGGFEDFIKGLVGSWQAIGQSVGNGAWLDNSIIKGLILGITQGIGEFLPISSSGHLALMGRFGVGEGDVFVGLMLHLSTLIVVCLVNRKTLIKIIKHPTAGGARFLIIATIPTAILAGIIRFTLQDYEQAMLPTCFMLTTVLLFMTRIFRSRRALNTDIGSPKVGLFCGIMQGVACLTGVSRSGAVITALTLSGVDEDRAEYTFLLSIPIIIGSAIVEILTNRNIKSTDTTMLAVAMVTAFIFGLASIKLCQKLINNEKIWYFGFYTFAVAILTMFL